MILAAISAGNACADPASSAPAMNTPKPIIYTYVRPIMSERRPTGMNITLVLRIKPSAIHCAVGMSAPKCSAMRGSAIFIPD